VNPRPGPATVDIATPGATKALKYFSYVGKLAGFVSALNVIPFVDPQTGVLIFAAASILKVRVNRMATCSSTASRTRASRAEGGVRLCRPIRWSVGADGDGSQSSRRGS
jgi:hypothetical protein